MVVEDSPPLNTPSCEKLAARTPGIRWISPTSSRSTPSRRAASTTGLAQIDPHEQQAFGGKAEVHALQVVDRPRQQAGANEQG